MQMHLHLCHSKSTIIVEAVKVQAILQSYITYFPEKKKTEEK